MEPKESLKESDSKNAVSTIASDPYFTEDEDDISINSRPTLGSACYQRRGRKTVKGPTSSTGHTRTKSDGA